MGLNDTHWTHWEINEKIFAPWKLKNTLSLDRGTLIFTSYVEIFPRKNFPFSFNVLNYQSIVINCYSEYTIGENFGPRKLKNILYLSCGMLIITSLMDFFVPI
jgi:hypothetical protein